VYELFESCLQVYYCIEKIERVCCFGGFQKVAMVSLLFCEGEEGDDCVIHWLVSNGT